MHPSARDFKCFIVSDHKYALKNMMIQAITGNMYSFYIHILKKPSCDQVVDVTICPYIFDILPQDLGCPTSSIVHSFKSMHTYMSILNKHWFHFKVRHFLRRNSIDSSVTINVSLFFFLFGYWKSDISKFLKALWTIVVFFSGCKWSHQSEKQANDQYYWLSRWSMLKLIRKINYCGIKVSS